MIATSPRSKLSIERSADFDVGRLRIVDEPHAVDVADQLHRVLETAERLDRARSSPPARAPAIAPRSPPPSRRARDAGRAGESRRAAPAACCRRRRSTIHPSSTTVPSSIAPSRANSRAVARPRRASSSTAGSSALITAQSSGVWFSKIRAFAARVRLDDRMPIEMVGREVQHHRDPRMKRVDLSRAESCWLRRREACPASTPRPARSAARRCCRRPSP